MKTSKLSTFIEIIQNKFYNYIMPVTIEMFFIMDELSDYESIDFSDDEEDETISMEELIRFWVRSFNPIR